MPRKLFYEMHKSLPGSQALHVGGTCGHQECFTDQVRCRISPRRGPTAPGRGGRDFAIVWSRHLCLPFQTVLAMLLCSDRSSPPYRVVAARSLSCSALAKIRFLVASVSWPQVTFGATENTLKPLRKSKTFCPGLQGLVFARPSILLLRVVPPVL